MHESFFDELEKIAFSTGPKKKKKADWGKRLAIGGALLGGGVMLASALKHRPYRGNAQNAAGTSARGAYAHAQQGAKAYKHVGGLKGVKTKADAKKAYRAAVKQHHPDLAGGNAATQAANAAKMKDIESPFFFVRP